MKIRERLDMLLCELYAKCEDHNVSISISKDGFSLDANLNYLPDTSNFGLFIEEGDLEIHVPYDCMTEMSMETDRADPAFALEFIHIKTDLIGTISICSSRDYEDGELEEYFEVITDENETE